MNESQSLQTHVNAIRRWFTDRDALTEAADDSRAAQQERANALRWIELETDADLAHARTVLAAFQTAYSAYADATTALYKHNQTAPPEPLYAIDGGYPVIYLTRDNDVICPACAHSVADTLAGAAVYYEGPPEYCAECNRAIDSAYGDPDDDDEPLDYGDRQIPPPDYAQATEQAIVDVQNAIDGRYVAN